MTIIKKYFSKQLTGVFFMLLLILTGLAWMTQIMFMMKFLLNYGINFSSFVYMTSLMIPFIISIIIPFVTFISVIFIYNKMISENEVTVMAASGLSPWQIAKPALWFAGIITIIHLILNLWFVPISQTKFYSTQWNLRFGLGHLKLKESAFTRLNPGLVVYVDKVSSQDLNQLMISDTRNKNNQTIIFAEVGKLVSTDKGLSIVTDNGALQIKNKNGFATGTFDSLEMDLGLLGDNVDKAFHVRGISTYSHIKNLITQEDVRQHKLTLTELCSRFINPFMNIILALVCTLILLKTSLLRRRASLAPAMAILTMAIVMATYMSTSNMLASITDLGIMAIGVFVFTLLLIGLLLKK